MANNFSNSADKLSRVVMAIRGIGIPLSYKDRELAIKRINDNLEIIQKSPLTSEDVKFILEDDTAE